MDQKRCPRCGEVKPVSREYFYVRDNGRPSGYCILCSRKNTREYKRRNAQRNRDSISIPLEKFCPCCGITKSSDEFSRNRTSKDGLHCYCKECNAIWWESYSEGVRRPQKRSKKRPSSKKLAGYIYVFRTGPYYKIGQSVSPKRRLRGMQTSIPYPVESVATMKVEDMGLAELMLHDQFKDKRHVGEWFLLDDEDVQHIMSGLVAKPTQSG